MTAGIVNSRVPVAYDATSRVEPTYGFRLPGSALTLDTVNEYAARLGNHMKSKTSLNLVIANLKLPFDATVLSEKLTITSDRLYPEQIDVTATDTDPRRASLIANEVVAVYVAQPHSSEELIRVKSIAQPPQTPSRPMPLLLGAAGGLSGLVVALALVYLIERTPMLATLAGPKGVMDAAGSSRLGRSGLLQPTAPQTAVAAAATVCVTAAAAISGVRSDHWLAFAAAIPLMLFGVLTRPVWRLTALVVGAVLVLQSSQDLSLLKIGYLILAAVISVISINRVRQLGKTDAFSEMRWMFIAGGALVGLLVISFVVALLHHTHTTAWLRDAAPYGLIALIPFVTADVAADHPDRRLLRALFLLVGIAAAAAYAGSWLETRGFSPVPVSIPLLPSLLLPGALFAYASANVIVGTWRWVWAAVGVGVGLLLLVSGNRASLVILVAPLAIGMVIEPTDVRSRVVRQASGVVAAAAAVLVAVAFAHSLTAPGRPFVGGVIGRWESIALITHDASWTERLTITKLAWTTFTQNPILGLGPGHLYEWLTPGGAIKGDYYLDTGLAILAKFGLAGLMVVGLLAFGIVRTFRDARLDHVSRLALLGYACIAVAWMPAGNPLEDKGFALGLLLLLVQAVTSSAA